MPRHWKESWLKIINKALWLLGVFWLLISLVEFFYEQTSQIPNTPSFFWLVFLAISVVSIISTLPPLSVVETVQGKDISIRLVIGNIFNQGGDVVISSNSTFDTTFTNGFVSPNSVQGQLYKREYDKIEYLDRDIEKKLQDVTPIQKHDRKLSKNDQYEIGTIIKLTHRSGFKTYWMALADSNEYGKPDGKFENLQICLESLWRYIGEKGHMDRLIMPVLGSGRTGINVNRITILKEIIFSFVAMTKERKITEELVICIHPSDINNNLDIYELIDYLKCQCKYRYEFTNDTTSKEIG
ncbi:MAG: DUF6430 domain-containing protein [Candidatus Marithrix sp.]